MHRSEGAETGLLPFATKKNYLLTLSHTELEVIHLQFVSSISCYLPESFIYPRKFQYMKKT